MPDLTAVGMKVQSDKWQNVPFRVNYPFNSGMWQAWKI